MSEPTSTLPPAVAALRQQALTRWQALAERERVAARVALAFVMLWVLWAVAVQPAIRTLRTAPAQLDALDAQLQAMQHQAAEVRELRAVSPVGTAQALETLKSATERLGDKAKLNLQGDRATLTLNGVSSGQLRAWLGEVRSGARARPLEAQLTRGDKGYSGNLVLALNNGGSN